MTTFVPGDLGGQMARFGQSLGNLGQTIFDIEAEEEYRTGRLALVSAVEDFKQSLWTDPDYGTPGKEDGYVGKYREFMRGSKAKPGAVGAAIGALTNVKAQEKLSAYANQLELEQGQEIEQLQFTKWRAGNRVDSRKRVAKTQDQVFDADPDKNIQAHINAAADEYDHLRQTNQLEAGEYEDWMNQEAQIAIKNGLKKGALAQMDTAADPYDGYMAAMKFVSEHSNSYTSGGDAYTAGEQVRESVATDIRAEYAMRQAALEKRSEEYLSTYQTQLGTDPETLITDISGELENIRSQNITKAAKDKATMALWDHNGDALYSNFSNRISSATSLADLTGVLGDLQETGALWQGKRQEQDRAALIAQVRGLIAERQRAGDTGDEKAVQKAQAKYDMLNQYQSVARKDNPSEELRRGAWISIMDIARKQAAIGNDVTSDALEYIGKLGSLTSTDTATLKSYDALYMKAAGVAKEDKLSPQQIQEKQNLMSTIAKMRDSGTMTDEQIDTFAQGALLDITKKTFQVLREDKLGGATLTTDTMLPAVKLIQSGGLQYQAPVAAGRTMMNPTIDANYNKARQWMNDEIAKQGFTDIAPKTMPDGSIEFDAKRKGLVQPYRLKPEIDETTGKMVLMELIQSKSKAAGKQVWEPFINPDTKKPATATPKAEAPKDTDKSEIEKIMKTAGDDPSAIAQQLVLALKEGRIKRSAIYNSGAVPMQYFDFIEEELRRQGL